MPSFAEHNIGPKLTMVAKSVHGLLAHLSGFTRIVHAGITSHHDFHSLVFFLVLLERTLRHLTYPQLTELQKRWALYAAGSMAQHLQTIWGDQVGEKRDVEIDETESASRIPAILNARFGGELWNVQTFDTLDIAWRGAHRAVGRDHGVLSRLEAELALQCAKGLESAHEALANAEQKKQKANEELGEAQTDLDRANEKKQQQGKSTR